MLNKISSNRPVSSAVDWRVAHASVLGLLLILLLIEFLYVSQARPLSDESFNFRQISRFLKGDISMEPEMNVIPGYHALVAALMKISGRTGIFTARFFSTGISFVAILVFYFLTGKIEGTRSIGKTLQFALFPLFFPFFPLVFTDVLGLLLPLVGLYLVLNKQYWLAGLAAILCVLARTNNIVWLVFLLTLVAADVRVWNRLTFPLFLRNTWLFWTGIFCFLIFLISNRGIAISNQAVQPLFRMESGNLIFLLFLFAFLFLPQDLSQISKAIRSIRRTPWILAILSGLLIVFWLSFRPDHPYNLSEADYYPRNALLIAAAAEPGWKLLFFIPVAFSLISMVETRLVDNKFYLLAPFTVLSLAPFWLIEPRYSFVPLAFFILFKQEDERRWVRYLTAALYLIVSVVFVVGMRSELFFL